MWPILSRTYIFCEVICGRRHSGKGSAVWVTIQSNIRVLNLSSTVSNHSQNVPLITSTFKLLLNKNTTNDRYSYNTSNNTGLRTDLYVQERERDTRTQSRVCRHPVGRSCTGRGTRSRTREREGDLGGGTLTQSHSPCCNNQSLEITIEASNKKSFFRICNLSHTLQ